MKPFARQLPTPFTPPQVVWLTVFCAAAGADVHVTISSHAANQPAAPSQRRAIEPPSLLMESVIR